MSLILYSRLDCPLCDDGLKIALAVARRHGMDLRRIDVDSADPETFQRHRYRVPIVCWERGGEEKELGWGRLCRARIEGQLRKAGK